MDDELRLLLERTLQVTVPLAEAAATHDTKFLNVLLGIYRVSFSTLRDIYYLSSNEGAGASALDLTRKIIDYGITVEYMLWKGKDKMAKKFQKHLWKEVHDELNFLKLIDQDQTTQDEQLKINTEEVEREYLTLSSEAKGHNSWAGLSFDKMIEVLHKEGKLKDFDSSRIGQAYIWGCRLNHVSPLVVRNYMETEDSQIASGFYLRQAVMFAIIFHLRLTTRYIDEIRILSGSDVYPELVTNVLSIQNELENIKAG